MKILISGGTGFIGSELCAKLFEEHEIIVLSRSPNKISLPVHGIASLDAIANTEKIDIAINLAGEPIADKRWTVKQKNKISSSRLETTTAFIKLFQRLDNKPSAFISGSAIGYYGISKSDDAITERAKGDDSFSSVLCQEWESVALQAKKMGIRTCLLRTGIVLGSSGGALAKMLPPFKLGLGGKIGSGEQWMPWIHIHDMVRIIQYCISNPKLEGPINCTAPDPVTNRFFSQSLAAQLKRPCFFSMPSVVVKTLMGELGEELLLSGKRVVPQKLLDSNFNFSHGDLKLALAQCL